MSELGKSVYEAFIFLDEFLLDVSRLVSHVEEKMTNSRLVAIGDSGGFWEHSRAYYAAKQWLPKYIVRHYTRESKKGRVWKIKWCAFIIVYLSPNSFKEPVAVWGIAHQNEDKNMYNTLKRIGLYQSSPDYLNTISTTTWQNLDNPLNDMVALKYQSIPIIEIKDTQAIDQIVDSLLKETEKL